MRFALAALLLCLLPSVAAAKPSQLSHQFSGDRYVGIAQVPNANEVANATKRKRPAKQKPRKRLKPGSIAPLTLAGGFKREVGRAYGQPAFVRGRLICAVNVGRALAARGLRGTGSALAKSYLSWGRASGPVAGAVAVFSRGRGGHVAIVHSVMPNGTVIYLNPSSRRQAWTIGPYRRRPIAFRSAA